MRTVLFASLAAALLFAGGCGPAKPMTEKEFKGFCYQYGEGEYGGDCDTISVCDPYTLVMNTQQASLNKCLEECEAIHAPQVWRYAHTSCLGPVDAARDWCVKYCRTAYPK